MADEPVPVDSPYDYRVAAKTIAWGVAKFVAAQASTSTAIAAFEGICAHLRPIGITVVVDQAILSQALPGFIFMGLIAAHDFAKVKTGANWL